MMRRSSGTIADEQREQLRALTAKIDALLPPRYQGCFEAVSPKSMGSATLRLGADGKVAWGEVWTTFCHLALAGGPTHRGTLLEPVSAAEVGAQPAEQQSVVAEIERAVGLTTDLSTCESAWPGWVGVNCDDVAMARWLVQAIVAENVSARHEGATLFVPAGPKFRVEKEIKNVVTSVAKTCHYYTDHMEPSERPTGSQNRLIGPAWPDEIATATERYAIAMQTLDERLRGATGLETVVDRSVGWIGLRCRDEEMAVWLLRAIAVEDVVVRREAEVLFVPVSWSTGTDDGIERVAAVVAHAHDLWRMTAC